MRDSLTSLILILLCLYLLVTNVVWIKQDKVVEGEESPHLSRSIQLYKIITYTLSNDKDEELKSLRSQPKSKPWNSFLFYSFVLPIYFIFGISSDAAIYATSLLHLIIALLTYLIGTRLVSKQVGLLAAFICALYPIMFNMTRQYSPNPAFVTFVLLSIYFLLRTEGFDSKLFSVLAGLSTGLALLLGYTNGTFIAAGYISEIVKIRKSTDKRKRILNLVFSLILGFLTCFWWYFRNLEVLLKANKFIRLQFGTLSGAPEILSLNSLLHYASCMIYGQIYLIYTLLAVTGLIIFIKKRKDYRLLTILWIAIPYLFLTFAYEAKNTRYTMPYLPLLAICTSFMFFQIKKKWLKNLAITLLIVHGITVHILSSFHFENVPKEIAYSTGSKICYKIPLYGVLVWGRIKPETRDFKLEKVLKSINDDIKERLNSGEAKKDKYKILFAPESPYFRPIVAGYYVFLNEYPFQIWSLSVRQFDYYISAFDFDYIVLRTANSMLSVIPKARKQLEKGEKALLSMPPLFSKYFGILNTFDLHDDSTTIVLKKVRENNFENRDDDMPELFEEGLNLNPESPFLHYKYSKFLKLSGDEEAASHECEMTNYWYNKNQEATGYLFLDYKEMTERMLDDCE